MRAKGGGVTTGGEKLKPVASHRDYQSKGEEEKGADNKRKDERVLVAVGGPIDRQGMGEGGQENDKNTDAADNPDRFGVDEKEALSNNVTSKRGFHHSFWGYQKRVSQENPHT